MTRDWWRLMGEQLIAWSWAIGLFALLLNLRG